MDHSPFETMARTLVASEYAGNYPLEKWNDYHIFAVDGSSVSLPPSVELAQAFGTIKGSGTCEIPCADISILYDVLHDWVVDASIGRYPQNERNSALAHIQFLEKNMAHLPKKIVLFDRGSPPPPRPPPLAITHTPSENTNTADIS